MLVVACPSARSSFLMAPLMRVYVSLAPAAPRMWELSKSWAVGQEVDQDHRRRAHLASAGLKGTVHGHVDRMDDKAANCEFRIEVHAFLPWG